MTKRYAKLSETVLGFLLPFLNCYMVEDGFSHINALLTNQENRLEEGEHGDLRMKLTNLHPNIH